ncbi:MAG: hypothetical protein ACXU8N_08365 [Telluria sp.]
MGAKTVGAFMMPGAAAPPRAACGGWAGELPPDENYTLGLAEKASLLALILAKCRRIL